MTMILLISFKLVAWLILHLIVNNLVSVIITFTVWWRVLITILLWIWMWEINIATLFLMLVSDTTRAIIGSKENLRVISLRKQIWDLILLPLWLEDKWNKKQLEKISISWVPEVNLLLRESKKGKTLLNLLFMLTIRLLIFKH